MNREERRSLKHGSQADRDYLNAHENSQRLLAELENGLDTLDDETKKRLRDKIRASVEAEAEAHKRIAAERRPVF